jgi:hypothetical protein
MQKLIAIWNLLTMLMPQVLAMIQVIENQFPQQGQGAKKLEMIRAALENSFHTIEQTAVTFEQLWPVLGPIINGAVSIFNSAGVFQKQPPQPQ